MHGFELGPSGVGSDPSANDSTIFSALPYLFVQISLHLIDKDHLIVTPISVRHNQEQTLERFAFKLQSIFWRFEQRPRTEDLKPGPFLGSLIIKLYFA